MSDDIIDDNDDLSEENTSSSSEKDESEEKSGISADLIRGHINTIILRTLYERDKYGYEIINEIEQKSHGQYTLKQPTLYSALKRLESQGYIKAYWKSDDVTLGGRRKYFKLTDSGREITEKNQAEWEYSRSVIDSLISDRSFDFSQPAPTPVDFKILKSSVSRVPTVKPEEGEDKPVQPEQPVVQENVQTAPIASTSSDLLYQLKDTDTTCVTSTVTLSSTVQPQPQSEVKEQERNIDEERKTSHENYLRLISTPAPQTESSTKDDASSEDVDTNKLIYNNKPKTERDYKKLINGIFSKAIKPDETHTPLVTSERSTQVQQSIQQPSIALDKAKVDGLKVNTTQQVSTSSYTSVKKKSSYNLGATLLSCSVIVGVLLLLEFVLCLVFKDKLACGLGYPFVIIAIDIAQFAVFAVFAFSGASKNFSKPKTNSYISIGFILTLITILIICVVGFLLNVNLNSAADIMKKLVIPCLTALAIPIFTACFYIFNK